MALTISQRLLIWLFKLVNFFIPWHWLPRYIGAINLLALRDELRQYNLVDTYPSADYQGTAAESSPIDPKYLAVRNSDGLYNDLTGSKMGCAGMRFGRNVPRRYAKAPTHEELMTPNPRVISERLLKRDSFKPAESLNLLAAAWIQFQVHDWAQHFFNREKLYDIPLPHGDKWSDSSMKVFATQTDDVLGPMDEKSPGYKNESTHWWDGSMIYGSSEAETQKLRVQCQQTGDGKMLLSEDGQFLPSDPTKGDLPETGFRENWWLGLEILHTLFVKEHNAICSQLRVANPYWTSDQLFDTARLINCALMAKIHTVEWTPGILAHPTLEIGMNANWWGLVGEKLTNILGRVSKSEAISGIPGSGVDQGVAPYCLTEEFVAVYRLHPLIPDVVDFFNVETGEHKITRDIKTIAFENARAPFRKDGLDMASVLYSFGINHPGAITHHNTPDFLRDLTAPDRDGENIRHIDMGVVDILRDRERGIPRYNAFRRLFHMRPARTFNALTGGNKLLARELASVYNNDIEKVDLLIGCLCEPLPRGFGFSDTAFRVFILMASRRLKSDRFIAGDFKPELYTHAGIEWVQTTTMRDVLCRHHPELKPALRDVRNAFAPWDRVGLSVGFEVQRGTGKVDGGVGLVNGLV